MEDPTLPLEKQWQAPRRGLLGRLAYQLGLALSHGLLDLRYCGQENIPSSGNFLIVANHQTYIDGLWIFSALSASQRRQTCAMVGADLADKHGLMGKLIMATARAIPVNRQGNPIRGLLNARNALLAGYNVLIHPEGTRTHDGRLAPTHSGAAYLAYKTRTAILPVYIEGGFEAFPRTARFIRSRDPESGRKRKVCLHIGQLLRPQTFQHKDELKNAVDQWLLKMEESCLQS